MLREDNTDSFVSNLDDLLLRKVGDCHVCVSLTIYMYADMQLASFIPPQHSQWNKKNTKEDTEVFY